MVHKGEASLGRGYDAAAGSLGKASNFLSFSVHHWLENIPAAAQKVHPQTVLAAILMAKADGGGNEIWKVETELSRTTQFDPFSLLFGIG